MSGTRIVAAAMLAAFMTGAGCAVVQPWERGTLAKSSMAVEAPPHEAAQKQRTYQAKEGGASANGVGGGGCGCN